MRIRILTLLTLLSLQAGTVASAAGNDAGRTEAQALELYRNALYSRARTLFESVPECARTRGYALLCAIRSQSADYTALLYDFRRDYASSPLDSQISFYHALNLFDSGNYAHAASEFGKVSIGELSAQDAAELVFKQGYCAYAQGDYAAARERLNLAGSMTSSVYLGETFFLLGLMDYEEKDFSEAAGRFALAAGDAEFGPLASCYLMECEFLQKNYSYVVKNGPGLFDTAPVQRKPHLARIISESFMVRGETAQAKRYYDEYSASGTSMTRSDLFYAASLLYASADWQGAIDKYLGMGDFADSLGQLALYGMGKAYMELGNRVGAMERYKDASRLSWRTDIKEDAWFNYAKLSFDLNKSTEGFAGYMNEYGSKVRGEQIYSYMALSALYDKDYEAAIRAYDNIDELDSDMKRNYVKANYLRATQLAASGSWRGAAPYFKAVSYYLPRTDRLGQLSRYWMAESSYRGGDIAEARKSFTELYNSSALRGCEEARLLPYDIAYCYFRSEEWQQAAKWFDTYISSADAAARQDALLRRADCDFLLKDYKAAAVSYSSAYEASPSADNIYPYYRQAISYGLAGDKQRKASVLSKVTSASKDAPLYADALYELGATYTDLGRYNDAVKVFEQLCATSGDSSFEARGWLGLGTAWRNAGNDEKALEYYKTVIRKRPGTEYAETALMAVESIYRDRRQPEKYLEFVEGEKIYTERADKAQMYFNTAEQVFLDGSYSKALPLLQKYITEWPEGESVAQAWFYVAECERSLGLKEDACDAYARCLSLAPSASFSENASLNYAALLFSLERYSEAYPVYELLAGKSLFEENKFTARIGMARSAYKSREWKRALDASVSALSSGNADESLALELNYIKAKSLLALERRSEAFEILARLASSPDTAQGAEARYLIIQDMYDSGKTDTVADSVYDFAEKAPDQRYWLARAYVVLGDTFMALGKKDFAKAIYESILEGYEAGSEDGLRDMVKRKLAEL